MTPSKAIRKYCVNHCMAGSFQEVSLCPDRECPLFPFRTGRKNIPEIVTHCWYCGRDGNKIYVPFNTLTTLKAIKYKCLDCSAGYLEEVRHCKHKKCFLYTYRLGKNPNLKGKRGPQTAEKKEASRQRLKKYREEKRLK